jgi:hypothetical protein
MKDGKVIWVNIGTVDQCCIRCYNKKYQNSERSKESRKAAKLNGGGGQGGPGKKRAAFSEKPSNKKAKT